MLHYTDLTGLFGVASVLAVIALRLPGVTRLAHAQRIALIAAVFVLALVPFGALPLAAYIRGATGDLSITTVALLWAALLNIMCPDSSSAENRFLPPCRGKVRMGVEAQESPHILTDSWWRARSGRNALLVLVAITALVFYPLALGVGIIDPYRIGYGEPLFVLALLVIALLAWFRKFHLIMLCLALALLAWAIGWYESSNLWDYLLDPFVANYALWVIAIRSIALARRGR